MSALEMKDTMYKLLPGVLLNLSKISATVSIAPNILEFLSTLNRLPDIYSSFVEEQYLSIFAITLPFINPFKVNILLYVIISIKYSIVLCDPFLVQPLRGVFGPSRGVAVVPVVQIPAAQAFRALHCPGLPQ